MRLFLQPLLFVDYHVLFRALAFPSATRSHFRGQEKDICLSSISSHLSGAPNDGIFPNASEVSKIYHSVLGKPV